MSLSASARVQSRAAVPDNSSADVVQGWPVTPAWMGTDGMPAGGEVAMVVGGAGAPVLSVANAAAIQYIKWRH